MSRASAEYIIRVLHFVYNGRRSCGCRTLCLSRVRVLTLPRRVITDAHPRLLLHTLCKRFPLTLGKPAAAGLLLRRRLVAGHVVMNVALLGLAKIEDAATTLAVNENGGFRVGALPFPLPSRPSRACLRMQAKRGPHFFSCKSSCPILPPGIRCALDKEFVPRGAFLLKG